MLDRRGWSLAQFTALPTDEQTQTLAWYAQRQAGIEEFIKHLFDGDKVVAEGITAQVLIALLRNG